VHILIHPVRAPVNPFCLCLPAHVTKRSLPVYFSGGATDLDRHRNTLNSAKFKAWKAGDHP